MRLTDEARQQLQEVAESGARPVRVMRRAMERGSRLVEASDGHFRSEIGENDAVQTFLDSMGSPADEVLLNRDEARLRAFLDERNQIRGEWAAHTT